MKRLQMETQPSREVEWSDCVAITYEICKKNWGMVGSAELAEFDHTYREPPVYSKTIALVNQRFKHVYGFDGFTNGVS